LKIETHQISPAATTKIKKNINAFKFNAQGKVHTSCKNSGANPMVASWYSGSLPNVISPDVFLPNVFTPNVVLPNIILPNDVLG
jgi:hypothetical protein